MDNNIKLTYWDFKGTHFYLFDKNGVVISKDNLPRSLHMSNDISLRYEYNYKSIDLIDLIDELQLERDWDYEYVENLITTNKPYEIAFITQNPTYGAQGIMIFKFNTSFDFDLIYEMEDLNFNGTFHNLTFNSNGDKYALLVYNHQDQKDYLTICEYQIKNNERSLNERPLRMFKTDIGYLEFGELNTEYLNDNTLCIVRNSDLILFDLIKGKTIKIINRDLNSSYSINSHSVEYELNEKYCKINIYN